MTRAPASSAGSGFTLIEMLVAMAIFAVIAAISYSGLAQFLQNRALVEQRTDRLHSLHTAMLLLEQDLRYAVNRPVRDGFGDAEPVLVSGSDNPLAPGEILRLTTSRPSTAMAQVQRLERVAWRLDGGKLQRVSWRVLDRDQDSEELARTVLADVREVSVEYFQWIAESRTLQRSSSWLQPDALPAGVEMLLTLDSGEQFRRVLEIANGS